MALIQSATPSDLAELSWRMGLILAAINFTVIGLAVSSVNPRIGRSANVVFALFAFVVYFNLLNLGQNWISSRQVSFGSLMVGLHGGVLVLTLFWLIKNHNNWQWWADLKRWLHRGPKAQT
jgi:lipopolysaccharide export system permease protein